jgi:CBS domain containing-hemolysin-like protein
MPLLAAAALTVWLAQNRYGRGGMALLLAAVVAVVTISVFQITPRLLMSQQGALERLWWVRPARFLVAALHPPVALLTLLGTLLLRLFGLLPARRVAVGDERERRATAARVTSAPATTRTKAWPWPVGGAPEIRDLGRVGARVGCD